MESLQKIKIWKVVILCFLVCVTAMCFSLQAKAAQEVTIYGLDSSYTDKITIPANMSQSYQINVGNDSSVSYKVTGGNSAKVSSTGLITPKYSYWKRYTGYSVGVSEGEPYDYYTLNAGDTTITATTGGKTYTYTVHVEDYSITYCEGVMDAYIVANISDNMTDLELVKAICRFPASYDYSAYYSGAYSMIINGGGDCWASTDAIIKLSEKLGIKAWSRNGNKDAGAGSGHMNAMVEMNGKYYELEAGYSMSKTNGYRPYDVTERATLFSCYYTSTEATIYQYDGYDTTGVLEIPETIGGRTVTRIYQSAFSGTDFTEIILPDTLLSIGDYAFSSCKDMTSIEIPASVNSIGVSIFADCTSLTDISIASDNERYKEVDQVIYSKDGTTLVTCPVVGNVTIPDTVTEIADYAFYYNSNIQKITIPESVQTMGEGAFGNCSKLSTVTIKGNGLTTIGTHCFRYDSALSVIRIPDSVSQIGAFAFASCSKLKHVYFMGDAPIFGETIDGAYYDRVFYSCTTTAYYPIGNTTWTSDVLTNHDGAVTWETWTEGQTVSIADAVITLEQTEYTYKGSYITPAVTVTLSGATLLQDTDYMVSYEDNRDAGTATVTVVGIGSYEDDVSTTFTINKASLSGYALVRNGKIVEKSTTEIYYVNGSGGYTYSSSDETIATVNEEGVITGVSAGTTTITVGIPESNNYLASSATVNIKVTHDPNGEIVNATVTNGAIQAKCPQCGKTYMATVPTKFSVYWGLEGDNYYTSKCDSEYAVGSKLECLTSDTSNADFNEIEILSHNTSVATVTDGCYINFIAAGTVQIEVRPKYNPSIGKVYTFTVTGTSGTDSENDAASGAEDDAGGGAENDAKGDAENDAAEKVVEYYNAKTGITISVPGDGKKTATLVSIKQSKAKGKVTIPNTLKVNGTTYSITSIGKNAFKGNTKITSVKMGSKLKSIGDNAFYGCTKLKSVTIGKNVTTIGNKAFYKCKKLTKITIPSKVSKIGTQAFYGCSKLKSITIKTSKLTTKKVGSKAFKGIHSKATIKVPKNKLKSYKSLLKKKGVGKKVKIKK